jgi:hypothetical protein
MPANHADLYHRSRIGLQSVRNDLSRATVPLRQSRTFVARGRDDGVENLAFMIDGDATEGVAYGSRRQISGQSVHQNRTVS